MDITKVSNLLKQAQANIDLAMAELATGAPAPTPTPTPAPTKAGRAPENPTGTVAGLDYTYHEGSYNKLPDFSKEKVLASGVTLLPTIDLRKRQEGYALRFTGYFLAVADGEYAFFTASDDGSRLYIGKQVVVENDAIQGTTEKGGTIALQKGLHALTIDYYNYGGPQELIVRYTPPGGTKQVIPASLYARVPVAAKSAAAIPNITATLR